MLGANASQPTAFTTTSQLRHTRTPPPPSASKAQEGPALNHYAGSPAFSTTSTADDGEASPILPSLPAPRLPERARELLRTASPRRRLRDDSSEYETASWGSPYPPSERNVNSPSISSEQSDDSPIHHLEITTPFLRPVPRAQAEQGPSLFSAAVLAKRARRPAHGLTEDWIRQHTAGDYLTENQAWLSDGDSDDYEPEASLISESDQDEDSDWLDLNPKSRTAPRANPNRLQRRATHQPNETLTQAQIARLAAGMSSEDIQRSGSEASNGMTAGIPSMSNTPDIVDAPRRVRSANSKDAPLNSVPIRSMRKSQEGGRTPRVKVKVPWKGKNIMVLLPRDDERGLEGRAPMPLSVDEIKDRIRHFQDSGYDTEPFRLAQDFNGDCLSRDPWPSPDDLARERASRKYPVLLPDLNLWKNYVQELQEAKLRALGVTFGEDTTTEPAQPSPVISNASRQTSQHYPPLPFSPPLPTGSAASNPAFNFSSLSMVPSTGQSPNMSVNSPLSFNGSNLSRHRPGQSIAIPGGEFPPQLQTSVHGWVQQLSRNGSPALAGLRSPGSPYENGGFPPPSIPPPSHARTQSLHYPMLSHQQHLHISARASPRLQELREDEEEDGETHEAPLNADAELQREIDDAEYHLEGQIKAQLEEDEYNPHHEPDKTATDLQHVNSALNNHLRQHSVQFLEQSRPDDLVLHHPTPHSRGHSLSQKFFTDHNNVSSTMDQGSAKPQPIQAGSHHAHNDMGSLEVKTNPSNLGSPVDNFGFGNLGRQHSFSSTNNPWQDVGAHKTNGDGHSRHTSHTSKASLGGFNAQAPEFKFSKGSNPFSPQGSYSFAANVQPNPTSPMIFKASAPEFTPTGIAGHTSQNSVSSAGGSNSKINANAPVFSPGSSEFSFSLSGPKFRPDAPAFTPFGAGLESATSDSASSVNPIFSNIDVSSLDYVKPVKKSKAIPIIKPPSPSKEESTERKANDSRPKRVKATDDGDNSVPCFSNSPEPEILAHSNQSAASPIGNNGSEENNTVEKSIEDDVAVPADMTTLSSTILSESADSKTTTTPDATSPEQSSFNWQVEGFKSQVGTSALTQARPLTDEENAAADSQQDKPIKTHKKTLSASAMPFTPGQFNWEASAQSSTERELNSTAFESELSQAEKTPTPLDSANKTELSEATPTAQGQPEAVEIMAAPASMSKSRGLAASRFANPSSPNPLPIESPAIPESQQHVKKATTPEVESQVVEQTPWEEVDGLQSKQTPVTQELEPIIGGSMLPMEEPEVSKEPSFEEIDDVMRHLDANPDMGVHRTAEPIKYHHPSPTRNISVAAITNSAHVLLQPSHEADQLCSNTPSSSPHGLVAEKPMLSTELEDPFVERSESILGSGVHNLNANEDVPRSDWDNDFSDEQQAKVHNRAPYFDRHVMELLAKVFNDKFALIQENLTRNLAPVSRRERRSISAELQHSDADDEDDEPVPRRSMSPRRNGRYELTKAALAEVLSTHAPPLAADVSSTNKLLEDIAAKLGGKDIEANTRMSRMQSRVEELEERLRAEQAKTEAEVTFRREAQDTAAELKRALNEAESRLERDQLQKTTSDARISDLEERLKKQEELAVAEAETRRAAEDKLSEIQRQLCVSSEEEHRLRDLLVEREKQVKAISEERDQKQKQSEESRAKATMRNTLLDANLANEAKRIKELQTRLDATEASLRNVQQEIHTWRAEADMYQERTVRQADDLTHALDESKNMRAKIATLEVDNGEYKSRIQQFKSRCQELEEEVVGIIRKTTEETQRLVKSEQNWLARQEILDARLQAEAKTRERIEQELARLESLEKQGVRAIKENERLVGILAELRSENHKLQQTASRFQREFEEARDTGLREVQRTRISMQTQLDASNHEVNVVREEYEEQNNKLRSQLDQAKLEIGTANSRSEMLVEAAENSKRKELEELKNKLESELEDANTKYRRHLDIVREDAQRSEQNYLERLSLATSKNEHFQERIVHLTERLEIADAAAKAAAKAAKQAVVSSPLALDVPEPMTLAEPGEKFSGKAFRETIDSLQSQLEAASRTNEELMAEKRKFDKQQAQFEGTSKALVEAEDENRWLDELLDIREADMLDLCKAVKGADVDMVAARDAAIRLAANIQMHQRGIKKARQLRAEPRRGGISISGLRDAAPWNSIRDAAPIASQALSLLGSWSKQGITPQLSTTPAKQKQGPAPSPAEALMTPPASTLRQSSSATDPPVDSSRPSDSTLSARRAEKMPVSFNNPLQSPDVRQPHTPPMMHVSAYDDDAQAEDFDDAGFFDNE